MPALAAMIEAIDRDDFPARLLDLLRLLAGTELCSAFAAGEAGTPHYLFSAGDHPSVPGFAEIASLDYARLYWQRDRLMRSIVAGAAQRGEPALHLVRQAWNGIADPEYRRACYERAGVVERISLYRTGDMPLVANAYRTRASGPSTAAEIARLEAHAGIVMAAVRQHARTRDARGNAPLHPPRDCLVRRLREAGRALSAREAEIAAALLAGRTQKEIAAESGVALSSVVTYRQRAYRKLGVDSRRGLAAFYEGLAHEGAGTSH